VVLFKNNLTEQSLALKRAKPELEIPDFKFKLLSQSGIFRMY
jgi:hypothetical protein